SGRTSSSGAPLLTPRLRTTPSCGRPPLSLHTAPTLNLLWRRSKEARRSFAPKQNVAGAAKGLARLVEAARPMTVARAEWWRHNTMILSYVVPCPRLQYRAGPAKEAFTAWLAWEPAAPQLSVRQGTSRAPAATHVAGV